MDGRMFYLAQTLLYLSSFTAQARILLNARARKRSTYPGGSSMTFGTRP